MKKKLRLGILVALLFTLTNAGFSQTSSYKNSISLKGFMVDYAGPLTGDYFDQTTIGMEYKYARFLNKSFNIAFPGRAGFVRYPSSENTLEAEQSAFGSLDLNLVYKLNNDYLLNENAFIAPYLFAGGGAEFLGGITDGDPIDFQIPLGVGFDIRITDIIKINVQSEYRLALINDYNNFKHSAGLVFLFGKGKAPEPPADRDGDGIIDVEDDCPDDAGIVKFKGCPDTDEDGIMDKADSCPKEAGPEENKGCPWGDADKDGLTDNEDDCPEKAGPEENKGCPYGDADSDGLTDNLDKCPNEKGPKSNNGCPVADKDKDGIADAEDACPDVAGLAKFKGCPDTDGDGVVDSEDRCIDKPGTLANKGCPEIKAEVKETLDLAMRAVQFETGKTTLKVSSYDILDQVVAILKEYPEYSCSISGHTDNVGSEGLNQSLSERRAKACYEYLVKKGVPYNKVSYTGFGEDHPIATNDTKEGRKLNRRTEFKIFIK